MFEHISLYEHIYSIKIQYMSYYKLKALQGINYTSKKEVYL